MTPPLRSLEAIIAELDMLSSDMATVQVPSAWRVRQWSTRTADASRSLSALASGLVASAQPPPEKLEVEIRSAIETGIRLDVPMDEIMARIKAVLAPVCPSGADH